MLKAMSRVLRRGSHRRHALGAIRALQARDAGFEDWIDLAMHFVGRGDVKIRTVQKRSEILALVRVVAELRPERILEIGTYRAGTLLLWSQLASRRVVTCDLEQRGHMIPLYEQFPPPGSACVVRALEGDTHDPAFAESVRRELDGPADFLFIDGDHTERGVEQDWDTYRGVVRPGGLIAFHDIVEHQPIETNQVHGFWRRLREHFGDANTAEFIDDPSQCGFGIGIVRITV